MKFKAAVAKVINIISIIIIIFAVVVLVGVFFTKSGEAPNIGGFYFFRVLTGSMEPEIRTDSLVVVKKAGSDSIKTGDVISYYAQTEEIKGFINTHRVIDVAEENGVTYYMTKGDANALADKEAVNENNVIGRVVWKSYAIGKLVNLAVNPLVFFPLIVVPLIVLIVTNLVSSIKTTKAIMKAEEEEAVREAIEEYKRKKKNSNAE